MRLRAFLRLAAGTAGLGLAPGVLGQRLEDLVGAGRRVLEGGLDPAVLQALQSGDRRSLDRWLGEASRILGGDRVLDMAGLEDASRVVLPVLESNTQTRGYASWLRSRMDYFKVAEDFRKRARGTPGSPGTPAPAPAPVPPNPTPSQERKAWERQVASQPAPKGAAAWVSRLKPVFRGAGAPPELVWLAEVESAFDPQARSPAGAVGLYQLMPRTAEGLGLRLQPQDERLVPDKSARAAAVYLRQMHRQFGDWRLALAAYNAGPGRVAETLRRRRATSFDAVAPSLPAETQMYVPKFEAVLKRRENRALSGLKFPPA